MSGRDFRGSSSFEERIRKRYENRSSRERDRMDDWSDSLSSRRRHDDADDRRLYRPSGSMERYERRRSPEREWMDYRSGLSRERRGHGDMDDLLNHIDYMSMYEVDREGCSKANVTEAVGKKSDQFTYIEDSFKSIDQVTNALRESGLESSNLIVGIDFTKSNEWTGKNSFNNRSLHAIGDELNPYEKAITVIGKTLAPFDEDNLIPCFGFGDITTHDSGVFSFNRNGTLCHGFEEVLSRYREIASSVVLSGPTSFGPIIEAAVDIVEESGGQFHVLLIVADGQVTRSINTGDGHLSKQERETINAIVSASSLALSVVLVGVGDGPWEDMKRFDDKIPARRFDNFQFVNFTSIMEKTISPEEKDALFAVSALMEIPFQYKATLELDLLSQKKGKSRMIVPRSPPRQIKNEPPGHSHDIKEGSLSSSTVEPSMKCPICLDKSTNLAFGCGHMICKECDQSLNICPRCHQRITSRQRVYTG